MIDQQASQHWTALVAHLASKKAYTPDTQRLAWRLLLAICEDRLTLDAFRHGLEHETILSEIDAAKRVLAALETSKSTT